MSKNSSLAAQVSDISADGSIYYFHPLFLLLQDEDLKWVEDNIPSSLTDV